MIRNTTTHRILFASLFYTRLVLFFFLCLNMHTSHAEWEELHERDGNFRGPHIELVGTQEAPGEDRRHRRQ